MSKSMNPTLKKAIAECIGTMILVLFCCGVATVSGNMLAIAFTFGLTIVALIYFIGPISGCHINPAVSLAAAMNKRITWKEFGAYVGAQFLGGILGAGILLAIMQLVHGSGLGLGSNFYGSSVGDVGGLFGGLIVEILLTFIFILAVLMVTSKKYSGGKKTSIIIGLALTLVHLFGIGFTGTSVNPARSFGPALFSVVDGTFYIEQVWLFLVAPMIGGALAAVVAKFGLKTEENPTPEVAQAEEVKPAAKAAKTEVSEKPAAEKKSETKEKPAKATKSETKEEPAAKTKK